MRGKKTGGRVAGTPNKTTEELRTMIQGFIENNWSSLQDDFEQMKPAEKANFRERLLRYLVPEALNPESLSESQLIQLAEFMKKKFTNE